MRTAAAKEVAALAQAVLVAEAAVHQIRKGSDPKLILVLSEGLGSKDAAAQVAHAQNEGILKDSLNAASVKPLLIQLNHWDSYIREGFDHLPRLKMA